MNKNSRSIENLKMVYTMYPICDRFKNLPERLVFVLHNSDYDHYFNI